MNNLQHKICNILTFLFLLGVIVAGTCSLWPEAEATPLSSPEPEEETTESVVADTLEEVPMIEDVKVVTETQPDSLHADTLPTPVRHTAPADSVAHPVAPAAEPARTEPTHHEPTHHEPATPADTAQNG